MRVCSPATVRPLKPRDIRRCLADSKPIRLIDKFVSSGNPPILKRQECWWTVGKITILDENLSERQNAARQASVQLGPTRISEAKWPVFLSTVNVLGTNLSHQISLEKCLVHEIASIRKHSRRVKTLKAIRRKRSDSEPWSARSNAFWFRTSEALKTRKWSSLEWLR